MAGHLRHEFVALRTPAHKKGGVAKSQGKKFQGKAIVGYKGVSGRAIAKPAQPRDEFSESAGASHAVPLAALLWAAQHIAPPACSDEAGELPFDTSKATRVTKTKRS
jgi:hypothetical protein